MDICDLLFEFFFVISIKMLCYIISRHIDPFTVLSFHNAPVILSITSEELNQEYENTKLCYSKFSTICKQEIDFGLKAH